MKKLTLLVCLLTSLLVFGACSDDPNPGSNDGALSDAGSDAQQPVDAGADAQQPVEVGPLDAQTFYEKHRLAGARAACETAFNDCPSQVRYLSWAGRATNVEECVEFVRQPMEYFDVGPDGIESGDTVFDEDAARDCLETIIAKQRADVCYNPSFADHLTCDKALTGTVAEGEECTSPGVCVSGICNIPDDPNSCTRTCGAAPPVAGEGDACGHDVARCDEAQNLVCDVAGDGSGDRICVEPGSREEGDICLRGTACATGLVCDDGTCGVRAIAQLGEACIKPPSNTNMLSDKPCAAGLVCTNVDANSNGTCAELGAENDACEETKECAHGLYCGADSGTCAPTKAEGEACEDGDECSRFLICMGGVCSTIPEGETGCSASGSGGL